MTVSHPYDWVSTEPSLVTPLGDQLYLIQRLGIQTSQEDPSSALVLQLSYGDVYLNGVKADRGNDITDYLSLADEADAVADIGQTYLSERVR